jgi:hypothetical protein
VRDGVVGVVEDAGDPDGARSVCRRHGSHASGALRGRRVKAWPVGTAVMTARIERQEFYARQCSASSGTW